MTRRVSSSSSQYSSRSLDETSALLPMETNAENPSPRALAASSSASPRAPLWDAKPIGPRRKRLPGERGVDARRCHGEPEAVRPEQAGAVGANQRQQPLLALRALAAHLGEAGGQHAERPRPPLERLAGHLEHASGRHADHRQIDGLGKLGDRADGGNASAQAPPIGSRGRRARRSHPRRDCGTPWPRSIPPAPTRRSRRCSRAGRTARARRRRPRGRGCRRARGSSRSARSGTRTSTDPPASVRVTSKPASAKTPSMARFSARTSATKLAMPTDPAVAASCSSSRVPTPFPCSASSTAKATSAVAGSRRRAQLATATIRSSPSSERHPTNVSRSTPSGSRNGATSGGPTEGMP